MLNNLPPFLRLSCGFHSYQTLTPRPPGSLSMQNESVHLYHVYWKCIKQEMYLITPLLYQSLLVPMGHVPTCQEWPTEVFWTPGMWLGGTRVMVRLLITIPFSHGISCHNNTNRVAWYVQSWLLSTLEYGASTFWHAFASGGSGVRRSCPTRPRLPHRSLRPVWSPREASNFGRWLIEWDDEDGEALGPILFYGFGLCSPADFAVSVTRLLGYHQSPSS